VKLLLDEMWPSTVAAQLRRHGHDAVAVAERADLRGLPDLSIFMAAQTEGRVIVTENVIDFRPLAGEAIREGRPHCGLIFTSNRRFPRGNARTLGRLVQALEQLANSGKDLSGQELWLQ
jgi:predicted nuclease of predicted toxin-antitoxin system